MVLGTTSKWRWISTEKSGSVRASGRMSKPRVNFPQSDFWTAMGIRLYPKRPGTRLVLLLDRSQPGRFR